MKQILLILLLCPLILSCGKEDDPELSAIERTKQMLKGKWIINSKIERTYVNGTGGLIQTYVFNYHGNDDYRIFTETDFKTYFDDILNNSRLYILTDEKHFTQTMHDGQGAYVNVIVELTEKKLVTMLEQVHPNGLRIEIEYTHTK